MDPNTLLSLMFASYLAPIGVVYYKYITASGSRSISSIITSCEPLSLSLSLSVFQTRHFIAVCMFIMAVFTILYEIQRCAHHHNDSMWSLYAIVVLLIGIFGVIYIPECNPSHYLFAGAAFFAILGFMIGHTICRDVATADAAETLRILIYAQFLFMTVTVIGVIHDAPIFMFEALFLLNFAVFYLYLHSIPFHSIPFHYTFSNSCSFGSSRIC
jgi:hypothetical protein